MSHKQFYFVAEFSRLCLESSLARVHDEVDILETVTTEQMHLTIRYEDGEDGWVIASIPQIPGVHTQGHNRAEARAMVLDALRTMLSANDADGSPDCEELPFALTA